MSNTAGEHVTLVVDPEFGERAKARARIGPLWVIDSPTNTPVIKELWASGERYDANSPTHFNAVAGRSLEDSVIASIDTVDTQHPNWTTFEIIGAALSPRLLRALLEYAHGSAVETPTGLIFSRDKTLMQEPK
jgi:hypothetical protein